MAELEKPNPCPLCGKEPQRARLADFGYATNARESAAVTCGLDGIMATSVKAWNQLAKAGEPTKIGVPRLGRRWEL
jgi:hypothetical protein